MQTSVQKPLASLSNLDVSFFIPSYWSAEDKCQTYLLLHQFVNTIFQINYIILASVEEPKHIINV